MSLSYQWYQSESRAMGTEVIEIPIFYGEDPERWVSWIDQFASAQGFSDFETLQFAYGFIEDESHIWYCKELSQSEFRSWDDLKLRLLQRFGKSVEDVMKQEDPSIMDLCRCVIRWAAEDRAKKQQEQETLVSKDADQIVSHVGGYLRNIDPIMDQIQRSSEEKKPEREEIHTSKDTESVVRESLKGVDQIPCLGQRVTTTESTTIEGGKEPREHNQNRKKKRKRWKKRFLAIHKCLAEIQSSGKDDTSQGNGNEWIGVFGTGRKDTLHHKGGKFRESKRESYAHQVLDKMHLRRELVMKKKKRKKMEVTKPKRSKYALEKRKNKTAMGCAGKGLKHDKEVYQRTNGKLSWKYRLDKKQLVKGKGFKFKLKHDRPKENITQRLSGNHIACIWNSELELELELFGKIFSHWSKRKHGCERTYLRCDKLLQLCGLGLHNGRLSIGITARKRVELKYKGLDYRKFLSLVIMSWAKLMIKLKKQRASYKRRNKTEYIHMLSELFLKEVAKKSKVFKGLGSVLMHENQTMGLASRMIEVKHNALEGLCKVIMDVGEDKAEMFPVSNRDVHSLCCLKDFWTRMKEGQNTIYITNESKKADQYSSFLEELKKKKYGVLYMVGTSDGYVIGQLKDFEGKGLVSATKEGLKLEESADEKIMKTKAVRASSMACYMSSKETREINPENSIMDELRKRAEIIKHDKSKDLVRLLFKTALLISNLISNDSNAFGSRIRRLFKPGLNINDEQMETRRVQMLQPLKQLSELCVPTVPAAIQWEETYTEADMGQEHHGLLQLLLRPTNWTALGSGKAAWRTSFFSMTLRTRSVSMAPVMISVPKEEEGPMDTSPRRMDH